MRNRVVSCLAQRADGDGRGATRVRTLPAQPGALIGRGADVPRVSAHLLRDDVRLLTLVGAAGAGKTRLAVEVASQTADEFGDGSWFVDLSLVSDPELVHREAHGLLADEVVEVNEGH